jgi:hypothetical protein
MNHTTYNFVQSLLTTILVLAGFLFVVLFPFMLAAGLRLLAEEMDLRSYKKKTANDRPVGSHRAETPKEKAKRELREEKERQAREDSFFDDYYVHGDDLALVGRHRAVPHPAWNLMTSGAHRALRELDEVNDGNIMQVATEG